jgi:16S rRNA (cytidine1402-2'-O)-methyltransferase
MHRSSPADDVSGTLFVVATPIGNVEDLSVRAREILAAVDFVAAEDTRHSGRLMQRFGIRTPLVSLHEHNEEVRTPALIERLQSGEAGALVSDAGTPLVSDPGYRLLRAAREAGVRVSPLPGPCAAIAALSVAGLPSDRFAFEGFLPQRSAARRQRLQALVTEPRTMIFYEAARRVEATLADIAEVMGGCREVTLARELTKLHEEVAHGTVDDLLGRVDDRARWRLGEIALVLAGAPEDVEARRRADGERVLRLLLDDGLSPRQSAALAARITGAPRNALYRQAIALASPAAGEGGG